jgi:hypothetical protein
MIFKSIFVWSSERKQPLYSTLPIACRTNYYRMDQKKSLLHWWDGAATGFYPHVHLSADTSDHADSLGVTCCQNVESLSRYWLSRPGLPLQVSSYWFFLRCWVVSYFLFTKYLAYGIRRFECCIPKSFPVFPILCRNSPVLVMTPISLRCILTLSSHLRLGLPRSFFLVGLTNSMAYETRSLSAVFIRALQ